MRNSIKVLILLLLPLGIIFFQNCAEDVDLSKYTSPSKTLEVLTDEDPNTVVQTSNEYFININCVSNATVSGGPVPIYANEVIRAKTGARVDLTAHPRNGTRVDIRKQGSATILNSFDTGSPSASLFSFDSSKAGIYEATLTDSLGKTTLACIRVELNELITDAQPRLTTLYGTTGRIGIGADYAYRIRASGGGVIEYKLYRLDNNFNRVGSVLDSGIMISNAVDALGKDVLTLVTVKNVQTSSYGWYRIDISNSAGIFSAYVSLAPL